MSIPLFQAFVGYHLHDSIFPHKNQPVALVEQQTVEQFALFFLTALGALFVLSLGPDSGFQYVEFITVKNYEKNTH